MFADNLRRLMKRRVEMSYLDRKHTSHRMATIIAVTAIEAAAIFAVVRGLAIHFNPPTFVPNPDAMNIPLPQPSFKPIEKPVAPPNHERDVVIRNPLDFGDSTVVLLPIPQPMPSASPMPQPVPDIGIAKPLPPQLAPRASRPLGRPSTWATSNDYPARDLREGNAGVTGFRLSIGSDGRVISCTVTASSGFPGLDRATCDNVSRRARFEPATDGSGAKVASSYANNIRWVIPD
jgi:protein TonB